MAGWNKLLLLNQTYERNSSTIIDKRQVFSWEQILSHFGGSDVSRPILRRVLKKHISSEIKSTVCTVRLVVIPVLQIKTALFGLSE